MMLILLLLPLIIIGLVLFIFIRGSRKTKLITSIACIVLVGLLFIPRCKPIDLSKEDNNPVTGAMQGHALLSWLEEQKSRNFDTGPWQQKNGVWFECWSGASVIKFVYSSFWQEAITSKVLIQGR